MDDEMYNNVDDYDERLTMIIMVAAKTERVEVVAYMYVAAAIVLISLSS